MQLIYLESDYTDIFGKENSIKVLLIEKNSSVIQKLTPQKKGKKGQFLRKNKKEGPIKSMEK